MLNAATAPVAPSPSTWHESIAAFKRALIARALRQSCGNRTQAARALGLQRTYLLRLMREMGVTAPRPMPAGRRPGPTHASDRRGPGSEPNGPSHAGPC